MKLKKNPNMHSIILTLEQAKQHADVLIRDFKHVIQLLDDTKLGVGELNYGLDEELQRFYGCVQKIETLVKSL